MIAFILRRLVYAGVVLVGVTFVLAVLVKLVPGDVVDVMIASNPGLTAADAARLTQRLINALPGQDEETAELRNGLWDVAIGASRPAADPKGLAMARRSYEGCQAALATGYMKNMRYCLELQHGEMMIERNHAFWREIGAGS